MERSSGLICFHLHSDTPSLVGPAAPPVGCSGLLLLHANRPTVSWSTSRGLRPRRFHAVWLSPWNHPHKNAVLSLGHGPGCQVQPGKCPQRLGEEESQESLILQLAPLCWAVVLRPGKPSILLSPTPKRKVATSVFTSPSRYCVRDKEGFPLGKGRIWSKLALKHLKSYQVGW